MCDHLCCLILNFAGGVVYLSGPFDALNLPFWSFKCPGWFLQFSKISYDFGQSALFRMIKIRGFRPILPPDPREVLQAMALRSARPFIGQCCSPCRSEKRWRMQIRRNCRTGIGGCGLWKYPINIP